ncbi:MAG: extensin family protein [Hyphomicrobiales bacterium]
MGKRLSVLTLCSVLLAASAQAGIILPKLKPQGLIKPQPAVEAQQEAPQPAPPAAPLDLHFPDGASGWSAPTIERERQQCRSLLAGVDMIFKPLPPEGTEGGCGGAAPIEVSAIDGVAISPVAVIDCHLADALHNWIAWSAKPAAQQNLGLKLVRIHNASSYVCRRRNNAATGKLSEHAFMKALDISTLEFSDGSQTTVKGDWSGVKAALGVGGKAAFLARIRRDACIRFTTVLGPGSDPYHGDHFHVDVIQRKNGYRICQ